MGRWLGIKKCSEEYGLSVEDMREYAKRADALLKDNEREFVKVGKIDEYFDKIFGCRLEDVLDDQKNTDRDFSEQLPFGRRVSMIGRMINEMVKRYNTGELKERLRDVDINTVREAVSYLSKEANKNFFIDTIVDKLNGTKEGVKLNINIAKAIGDDENKIKKSSLQNCVRALSLAGLLEYVIKKNYETEYKVLLEGVKKDGN